MKLVVYLPALNEAATIGGVLDRIPEVIPGVSELGRIVVDDGSTDGTTAIARRHGADVVRHARNLGTGRAFVSGVTAALKAGADIIVALDADGQFDPRHIPKLIEPIVRGEADVVLCTRFGEAKLIGKMPFQKRLGNWLLSRGLSLVAGRRFTDVSCGFRAFTSDAALRLDIHSDFEYIHESLLTWSRAGLSIVEAGLPVLAQRTVGNSRVVSSVLHYALQAAPVLIRAVRDYSPMKFFGLLSIVTFLPSFLIGFGVFVHWLRTGETIPYTSLIPVSVGGVLLAFLLGILALVADLIARVRHLVEELVYESRKSRTKNEGARRFEEVDV